MKIKFDTYEIAGIKYNVEKVIEKYFSELSIYNKFKYNIFHDKSIKRNNEIWEVYQDVGEVFDNIDIFFDIIVDVKSILTEKYENKI